jgi:hypothetical protein
VADNQLERRHKNFDEANDFDNNKTMFKRSLDNPRTVISEAPLELDEKRKKLEEGIIALEDIELHENVGICVSGFATRRTF